MKASLLFALGKDALVASAETHKMTPRTHRASAARSQVLWRVFDIFATRSRVARRDLGAALDKSDRQGRIQGRQTNDRGARHRPIRGALAPERCRANAYAATPTGCAPLLDAAPVEAKRPPCGPSRAKSGCAIFR